MFAVIEFVARTGRRVKSCERKFLRKSEDIDTETWRLYNVKRIFYETGDYHQAVAKLKKAEDTSDLQTECDDEILINNKRKRVRPAKFIESSDDEDIRQLPAPPPVKRALFKATTPNADCILNDTTIGQSANDDCSFLKYTQAKPGASNTSVLSALSLTEKSAFQVLLENVLEIKNQNKIILSKISNLVEGDSKILPEIPVKLPVKTLAHLDILEKILQEKRHSDLLVAYYSGLGGNNINSKTNRILKETLDNSLASQFHFYGRNNKKAFANSKLSTCVIDDVKSSCGCTTVQVEGAIKIWLKHALQRLKSKNRGRNGQNIDACGEVDQELIVPIPNRDFSLQ